MQVALLGIRLARGQVALIVMIRLHEGPVVLDHCALETQTATSVVAALEQQLETVDRQRILIGTQHLQGGVLLGRQVADAGDLTLQDPAEIPLARLAPIRRTGVFAVQQHEIVEVHLFIVDDFGALETPHLGMIGAAGDIGGQRRQAQRPTSNNRAGLDG